MKQSIIFLTILLCTSLCAFGMESPASETTSGTISPGSFIEQTFNKLQRSNKSLNNAINSRKKELLQELINLRLDPETKDNAHQHALSLRCAEKNNPKTYDRACFEKVEFWAADSQILLIATLWATTNTARLKSWNNLDEYEAAALNLRRAADKKEWTQAHLIEQLILNWKIMREFEVAKKNREIDDPSLKDLNDLNPEAAAAVDAATVKGKGFTISRLKRRSGYSSGQSSGSSSPSGQTSPKDKIN